MTISLPALLEYCTKQEIHLAPDNGDGLIIDAPPGTITPDVWEALRTHKRALLAYLKTGAIIFDAQTATVADVRAALDFFKESSRTGNSGAVISENQEPYPER